MPLDTRNEASSGTHSRENKESPSYQHSTDRDRHYGQTAVTSSYEVVFISLLHGHIRSGYYHSDSNMCPNEGKYWVKRA